MKKEKPTYQELEQKIKILERELKIRDKIIDKNPNPLFFKNKDFRYAICNSAFVDCIGLPKEKIINSTVYDVSPKELADVYYQADKELAEKKEKQIYEAKVKRADESMRDILFHKTCLFDDQNNFEGILGVMIDITEKKKAQKNLKESEERYKKIIETSLVGIGITEHDKLIFGNPALFNIFGYTEQEALNKSILIFFHPNDKKIIIDRMKKRAKGESVSQYMHLRVLNKNGEIIYIKATNNEFVVNNKKYLQTMVVDITKQTLITQALKQSEKKLKELDTTKNKFFSILAHDLRNPINALLGFSKLLLSNFDEYDIDRIKKYVLSINKISNQTSKLLEDLLLWSKSQTNSIAFNPTMQKIQELCEETINNLQQSANAKQISIKYFEPEELFISADLNMVKTILRNLISNAIKYTHRNGEILIYTEKQNQQAVIIVSDNGVGIEPEYQNRIWEINNSHSTPGTEKESGSGFGLILCKEFVEKHGGKIWVESELGQGSDFKFTIPLYS